MSPSDTASRDPLTPAHGDSDLRAFGFDGPHDAWLDRLRRAHAPSTLGRLGEYELLEEVARGGQGVVYRAIQPGTGRCVALKRLALGTLASESMRLRFAREVESAAALDHPGIVRVLGFEQLEGQPALVMEWVDGIPVTQWSSGSSGRRPRLRERIDMAIAICAAVEHAHQRGILHRDLKPANVLVDSRGAPRVLDFGIARAIGDGVSAMSITATSELVGTPAYAAPEQLLGGATAIDARADVYALGALLYEMLCGRTPFARTLERGGGVAAVIHSVLYESPPSLGTVARLPRELDAIVGKALAKDPAHRYQSVAALAGDLARYQAGEPLLARPPTSAYLLRRLAARKPFATALVVIALATVLAGSALAIGRVRRLAADRDRAIELHARESRLRAGADEERRRALAAEQESEQALALANADRARAQRDAAQSRSVMAFIADTLLAGSSSGRTSIAPQLLEDAAERVSIVFRHEPEVEAAVHAVLGRLALGLGWASRARWHHANALVLRRSALGDGHPAVARSCCELGRAFRVLGDQDASEWFLREALRRQRAALGDAHPETMATMRSLALQLCERGDLDEPAALLEQLVSARRERHLACDPDLALLLSDLGWTVLLRGEPARAEALLEESLALHLGSFGAEHLRVAVPYERVARARLARGDRDGAEACLRAAVEIRTRYEDANRPALEDTLRSLAVLLEERGAAAEAGACRGRADALRVREIENAPPEDDG